MPRDGSGILSWPANGDAVPNTTISSTKYNTRFADLLSDLNAARPITAGGTNAVTAVGGIDNLNAAGANIASAATVDMATATGAALTITGTTTISAFGTVAAGAERILTFAGILTLTYNATSLILPGAANIVTAAGDVMTIRSLGGGNWKCVGYQRATGQAVVNTLVLKQSTTPAPTAEGEIQWDTDDDAIAIGDGAATRLFVPIPASTAAGDIEYYSGAKAKARLAKGAALQALTMNAGATAPQWLTVPFTRSFESTQQTITTAGTLTLAHGLGVQPKLYSAYIVCVTAEQGYSIGDEMSQTNYAQSGVGMVTVPGVTNMVIRFGSNAQCFFVPNKTTGTDVGLTNANWKLIIRAWA